MAVTRARLFGLTLESQLPLPALQPAEEGATTDVRITCRAFNGDAQVEAEGIRFAVRDGREILIDAPSGTPERNIRLFLLGSAMGVLLHQRGLLPLHANAVAVGGSAIAVAGAQGAGKSTLAAWLHRHGHSLLGDDVVAIDMEGELPFAYPGVPRFRLWREAIEHLGLHRDGLERSYVGEALDKWDVPADGQAQDGLPLRAIYVLEDGPDTAIQPLGGGAAVEALFAHTYRGGQVAALGLSRPHWEKVMALARAVPVFCLARPRDLIRLPALGSALLDHARIQAARTGA